MPIPRFAFTTKCNKRVNVLDNEVGISEPCDLKTTKPHPDVVQFKAIWDTGASCSCISQNVLESLNLPEIDRVTNNTANGSRKAGVYLVNIYLPNKVVFQGVRVIDAKLLDTDILIGMDIINQGDFAITHKKGNTWMTFQIPSSHNIDFVEEIERENAKLKAKKARKKSSKKKF